MMPSNRLILCCPLLLPPLIFPSIRVFSNESVFHIRWPKYWSFSFSISPSNEYSGLISFSIDWLDLLAVQGTLKSLLQHHSLKASILRCSAFFIVQLSRWLSGKESSAMPEMHRGCRFDPWVRKIPWKRKQQPTPLFLPGQRSPWWAAVRGVAKSKTRLSPHIHTWYYFAQGVCKASVCKVQYFPQGVMQLGSKNKILSGF